MLSLADLDDPIDEDAAHARVELGTLSEVVRIRRRRLEKLNYVHFFVMKKPMRQGAFPSRPARISASYAFEVSLGLLNELEDVGRIPRQLSSWPTRTPRRLLRNTMFSGFSSKTIRQTRFANRLFVEWQYFFLLIIISMRIFARATLS